MRSKSSSKKKSDLLNVLNNAVFLQKAVFAKSRGLFVFLCLCACLCITADARDGQHHCDAGLQQV